MSYRLSLLSLSDSTAHSKAIMLKDGAITTFCPGESIVCRLRNCPQLCFLTASFMVSFLAIVAS